MRLDEIFRNFQNEIGDNASCVKCTADFTVPEIAERKNAPLACPNCGEPQTAQEAIASRKKKDDHISAQAPDIDPGADSEWASGKMGS